MMNGKRFNEQEQINPVEIEDSDEVETKGKTDPYGNLEWAVGSGDDFVCFDYHVEDDYVILHSVINSETGGFIQDFEAPVRVPRTEAAKEARSLVEHALDWCANNDVRHSVKGWNQDPYYFVRCVRRDVEGLRAGERARVARKNGKS